MSKNKPSIERCVICGDPTGKAGLSEDSLVRDDGVGPVCEQCYDQEGEEPSIPAYRDPGICVTLLLASLLLFLIYLLSACGFPAWRDQALRDVAEGRWHAYPEQVPAGGAPSQTFELYDAAGRHLGYGSTSGGTVNVYGPDGSRLGNGRR